MKAKSPTKKQIIEALVEEAQLTHKEEQDKLEAQIKDIKENIAQLIIGRIEAGLLTFNHLEVEGAYNDIVEVHVDVGIRNPLRKAYEQLYALPNPRRYFDVGHARRQIVRNLEGESLQEIQAFFALPATRRKLRKILNP